MQQPNNQTIHQEQSPTIEGQAFENFLVKWNLMKNHTPLRLGQYFHQYFKLEKSEAYKDRFDVLYQLDGQKALAFIRENFIFT